MTDTPPLSDPKTWWMNDLAEKLTAHLPHGQALGCTGLAAAWCPLHGDCTCMHDDHLEQDDNCPLHGGAKDPFTVLHFGRAL